MADIRDIAEQFIAPSIVEAVNLQYHPYEVGWLQDFTYQLGGASDRPEIEYRAYAIPGDVINAFAIPGGNVYVYEGILARFNKPTVSGVLGHEITHVAKRHCMDSVIAAYGIDFLTRLFQEGRGQELADLVLKILWRGYAREQEFEADKCSIHYNLNADLWPYGIKYFLEWLVSVEETPTDALGELLGDLLATHPPATERLEKVNAELARLGIEEKSYGWEKTKKVLPYAIPIVIGLGIAGVLIYLARKK